MAQSFMKATYVGLNTPQAAIDGGRRGLVPELLASVGARYSRNNEGLDKILELVDARDQEKSIDAIFKHVDYGHASLMDLVPVSIFLDGISMFAAYYIFSESPMQGGQESSTRYLKIDKSLLLDPINDLGIDPKLAPVWQKSSEKMLDHYADAYQMWLTYSDNHPEATRIPESLLSSSDEKSKKTVDRMLRNFAFDRSRYFIPVGCATNMMAVMSAREWVRVVNLLLSSALVEFNKIGEAIKAELAYVAPRLIKHAIATDDTRSVLELDFREMQSFDPLPGVEMGTKFSCNPRAFLRVDISGQHMYRSFSGQMVEAMSHRKNRYSVFGRAIRDLPVVFGWEAMAFAEIRDLNRHRTGSKYCPLKPRGFYCAIDAAGGNLRMLDTLRAFEFTGHNWNQRAIDIMLDSDQTYIYHTSLGTQYWFEHKTMADKMLYTAELRTGLGSHYRYAKHFHDLLVKWYRLYPETRFLTFEGRGEPE